jgi:hypothetical protein
MVRLYESDTNRLCGTLSDRREALIRCERG